MNTKRVVKKPKKKNLKNSIIILVLVCLCLSGIGIKQYLKFYEESDITLSSLSKNKYSVSSSSDEASKAAVDILENGGNAVDAAIALAYTLAVVEPYGSGLGGGGCMVVYDPESKDYHFYNYASEAPESGKSRTILVPGFVSGMETILNDLGTKSLDELLQTAIEYCDGFVIDDVLENRINKASGILGEQSIFFANGEWLGEGDTIKQPELKETLQLIVEEGAKAFYEGTIGKQIAENTPLTMKDLTVYETIHTKALVSNYLDYEIVSAPAPFSGATLIQMLKAMEFLGIENVSNGNDYLDILQEATIISHAQRTKNTYDLRFSNKEINEQEYISDDYIANLLDMNLSDIDIEEESEDTTAFTIVDKNGMIVTCTNTLSGFFGVKSSVAGIFMNSTGINFGTGVNAYEAGKRPRTHIAPTILQSEDEVIAVASPGGSRIIKVLVPTLVDICKFKEDPQKAVDKRRVVFKSKNIINYEIGYDTDLIVDVKESSYSAIPVKSRFTFGNISISGFFGNDYYSVSDFRRNGKAYVKN